jgi:hypothetical protein
MQETGNTKFWWKPLEKRLLATSMRLEDNIKMELKVNR